MCSRSRTTESVAAEVGDEERLSSQSSLTDANFDVPRHLKDNAIVRKYICQWNNSMEGLANNPEEATWRAVQGHEMDLFGSKTRYAPGAEKRDVRCGNLEQAILIGMKVLKVESTFPCQLGLTVTGAKGNYYTSEGRQYLYMVGSNEKVHNLSQIVATTNPYVNSEYIRLYPGMTKDNLRSNGILAVPGEQFVFVDKNHPIVEMMQENQETLHLDIDNAQLIDDRWFKVSKVVTDRCIAELENELVDHLPLLDLKNFSASIHRLHGASWDDQAEVCDDIERADLRDRVMNSTRRCSVVLEVTYCFP